jgi:hypothetical protein
MNVLQILQLLPAIFAAVRAIEEALPLPDKGREKLDLALEAITAANESLTAFIPQLTKVVAAVVRFYNATGWGK